MLIFQANPEEYSQLTALLQSLDKPAKSALIEVTVAELSVDKNSQLGVEWFFNQSNLAGGSKAIGSTLGGLSIGTSGFMYRVIGAEGGSPRLLLNALAADNKATILSSPRISARNGETATIQVGQEVPIVTSQQSGSVTTATGALSVLQTIQYRSTGVILKVKPAIHSGDQIDLDVTQEVSAAQSTTTGVSTSPTIGTRKFDTKLTLRNGSTVMLGGLISDESSGGNAGIPLLKDVPVLGQLFSTQSSTGKRRELIVLITPYVLNNQGDAEAITDAFRRSLGAWAGTVNRPGEAPQRPAVEAGK
jgi:general secretion pathway protein D